MISVALAVEDESEALGLFFAFKGSIMPVLLQLIPDGQQAVSYNGYDVTLIHGAMCWQRHYAFSFAVALRGTEKALPLRQGTGEF